MTRPYAELDIECFHNWFLVGITDHVNNMQWDFQMVPGSRLDVDSIRKLLAYYTVVTFNGTGYDIPILMLALQGADCAMLKQANDEIIVNKLNYWAFYKKYRCYPPDFVDHIDVSEPTPGVKVSLKAYACRLSSELVQDSPVDFSQPLPYEHVPDEIYYCRNDRSITRELREAISKRLDVRMRMSERYGVDLRSKSDAQMAEAMVKAEWARQIEASVQKYHEVNNNLQYSQDAIDLMVAMGDFPHLAIPGGFDTDWRGRIKPIIPHYRHGTTFKVKVPEYVHFVTPEMQSFLHDVRNCDFFISDKDEAELMGYDEKSIKTGVLLPEELKGRDIVIGKTTYRVGIGGLHSQESSKSYKSIPGVCTMITADVRSYYPSLILNAGMYPPQLGPLFLSIYSTIYKTRLEAKAALKSLPKDTQQYLEIEAVEGGFKIVLNGTFGKLFNRYSIFYAPELGIAVTIGGQLSLLMLAERMELAGIRVVSANTDGIELCVPWGKEWIAQDIIKWWENTTKLGMDQSSYLALYSRDVNNYIRLDFDGSVKRKGVYGESGVLKNKHPDLDVCSDAVVAFLCTGKPLMDSIVECKDVRKFVRVRGASGGAVWVRPANGDHIEVRKDDTTTTRVLHGGEKLGRAVRWYYAANCDDYIVDGKSNNMVAGSEGARPIMRLTTTLPSDINYNHYLKVAEEMLSDIAYGMENAA
jgi:hypothetical protein